MSIGATVGVLVRHRRMMAYQVLDNTTAEAALANNGAIDGKIAELQSDDG